MDVSVIIVNYKTAELTIQSIESVIRVTENIEYEIIVIDNASNDGSIEKIAFRFPDIKLICNTENLGFGRANNIGIEISKGTYVFLLNSDAFLISNALPIFKSFMDSHPEAGVCGGHLITGREDLTVSYGNLPSMFENFSMLGFYVLYKKFFNKRISSGIVNNSKEIKIVGYVNGADMFIRKSVLDKIGNFDPDFFMYFEETELSFRISKGGYKSFILPEVVIIHLVGGSQKYSEFNYFKYEHHYRSKIIYFKKSYNFGYALVVKVLTVIAELLLHITKRSNGSLKRKMAILLNN